MMQLFHPYISFLKSRFIELQRWIDHSWSMLRGVPLGRYSKITPHLYLGGQPYLQGNSVLQKWGVTAVVNMRLTTPIRYFKTNFTVLHLPTPDQHPPTMSDLQKGVKFIAHEIEKGGTVYIHCRFGEGRGPSMVVAYLISQGVTCGDALGQIKKVRPFIRPTVTQIARLNEYEQFLLKQ